MRSPLIDISVPKISVNLLIIKFINIFNVLSDYIDSAHSVLLLTVNPGFSNQNKAVNLLDRITEFKNTYPNYSNLLIVDGGVKNEELQTLRDLKVDIAVQGGAIFAK